MRKPLVYSGEEPEQNTRNARRRLYAVRGGTISYNLGLSLLRPVLPLYIRAIFGAEYQHVTWIPAAFGLGKLLTDMPTGVLMDQIGRKRLLVGGLLLVALLDLGSGVTPSYAVFLVLRGLTGVGWAMFITTATTITIDTPGSNHRGRSVGVLFMAEKGGTVVGAAIGGWISGLAGLHVPFFLKTACALVGAMLCRRYFPREDRGEQRGKQRALEKTLPWGELLLQYESILLLCTSFSLFAAQTGLIVSLYPVYLAEEGTLSPTVIGLFVSMGALANALALYLGGMVSDMVDRRIVLIPGLLCYGLSLLLIPFTSDPTLLDLLSFTLGTSAGAVSALPTAMLGDRIPPVLRGSGIGVLRLCTDAGMVIGPLGLGALADWYTLHLPFYLGGGMLICIAGLHTLLFSPHGTKV